MKNFSMILIGISACILIIFFSVFMFAIAAGNCQAPTVNLNNHYIEYEENTNNNSNK